MKQQESIHSKWVYIFLNRETFFIFMFMLCLLCMYSEQLIIKTVLDILYIFK